MRNTVSLVVILTKFVHIALYHIQYHFKYSLDGKGLDDIKMDYFIIGR